MENGYETHQNLFSTRVKIGSILESGFFCVQKKQLICLSFQLPSFIVLRMGVIVF